MLLFVLSYLGTHAHPGLEGEEDVLVYDVYLRAKLVHVFLEIKAVSLFVAHLYLLEQVSQALGGELLPGVALCAGRIAVGLYHQPVQTKVKRTLGQFQKVFAAACHMTRVCEEGQLRVAGAQLDGKTPARVIAVGNLLVGGETAVDYAEPCNACLVEPLKRAYP